MVDDVIIVILGYIQELVMGLGIVGNLVAFVIFSRKTFENSSISVYLRAMALTDCSTIVCFVFNIVFNHFNLDLYSASEFSCKLVYYSIAGILPISDWLLATFSIDTMLRVLQTNRFAFINKKLYQILVVLLIIGFNCGLYSLVPATLNLHNVTNGNSSILICDLQYIDDIILLSYIYVIESSLVPFCIMLTTTVVIVRCLQKSRTKLGQQQNNQARKSKEIRFATSSIVFNVLFVVFKSPITYYYITNFGPNQLDQSFYYLALVLYFFNYSFRFVFHCIGNAIFRRELLALFKRGNSVADITTVNRIIVVQSVQKVPL